MSNVFHSAGVPATATCGAAALGPPDGPDQRLAFSVNAVIDASLLLQTIIDLAEIIRGGGDPHVLAVIALAERCQNLTHAALTGLNDPSDSLLRLIAATYPRWELSAPFFGGEHLADQLRKQGSPAKCTANAGAV